jgi:Cu(I)/Ag(I) efflux system protein CusF
MKKLFTIAALALAAFGAAAQTTSTADMAEAEIRKVDLDAKKVTLKHGPIKNLDMPPMTMVFQVRDAALLDKLKAGDKVRFSAEQQQGAYVVTAVEKVDAK